MTRRGLRLSQLPLVRSVKPKPVKTSAQLMAEDTLRCSFCRGQAGDTY